jgi:hypothetical protein
MLSPRQKRIISSVDTNQSQSTGAENSFKYLIADKREKKLIAADSDEKRASAPHVLFIFLSLVVRPVQ